MRVVSESQSATDTTDVTVASCDEHTVPHAESKPTLIYANATYDTCDAYAADATDKRNAE